MGFALAVTHPQAGNLGGGGFMLIHLAKENKTIALDFRETAPAGATTAMFLKPDQSVDHKSPLLIAIQWCTRQRPWVLTALNDFGSLPRRRCY